ncbi:Pycsar system effector family protein [Fulvimarina sp. MAC8]|uniref:Pycsar system effector family protein n=1 Tax=Fulvimarina sp. MAC8 TaxID=3162874 RepID=UPI0032EB679E
MIDFVKFAETKNAALLTFTSVWIGSIIGFMQAQTPLPLGYDTAFLFTLPLLCVAALISLASFLPRRLHHHHRDDDGVKNLLFFGDIAQMEPRQYGKRVRERYLPPENVSFTERYLEDLTVQISVQAHIADRKFKAFNRAARLVIAAFGVLTIPVLKTLISIGARYAIAHGWL